MIQSSPPSKLNKESLKSTKWGYQLGLGCPRSPECQWKLEGLITVVTMSLDRASHQNKIRYYTFCLLLWIYIYICVEKCVCDFSRFLQACPKSRTLQYHYHYIIASSHRSSAQRQADPHPPLGQRHRGIIIITIAGGLVHSNPWIQ